ncbi:MAG TPA: Flp pilus assembly protein CpaB [Phycisphaerae bacterium]|nr:Flp pilus assembly protein CpaB [Phycisphaerae bacterium]
MKAKTIVPLVLGLGVGFFAVKMGIDLVKKAQGAQGSERVVFVSAKTIEVATKITDSMLTTTKVPETLIPPNAFTEEKALVGRVSGMTIAPGVPITASMLAPPGAEPGLAAIIPKGHRAVAVSVNEESAVGGFILPGAHVDVSTVDEKTRTSKLILTDVEVGAVGQSLSEVGSDGKTTRITKSVTLFLEPHEVQTLHAHSGKGRIRLAMRGASGDTESSWSKILANAMASAPRAAPAPKARPKLRLAPPRVVEVVRGSETQTLVFDPSGRLQNPAVEAARRAAANYPSNPTSTNNPATMPPEAIE